MATPLMRAALRPLYEAAAKAAKATKAARAPHPGLLLQRGLVEHDDNKPGIKTGHVDRICRIAPGDFYCRAYARWKRSTADTARFRSVSLKLRTRLFSGLTGGGMLETGCAISRTYGTPYIPGSSVKGAVAAYALQRLDQSPDIFRELFGARSTKELPAVLSGLIAFHDAWWVPDSAEWPLVKEVVTTHHLDYYSKDGRVPATDFDSPIPNAQVAAQGAFLFVVEGPNDWLDLAERMLVSALTERGVGAKTRAGYGLFAEPEPDFGSDPDPDPDPDPGFEWVEARIAELNKSHRARPDETLRGKGLAEMWAGIEDPDLKRSALADIRRRWEEKGWWDKVQGKSARKAREIYGADSASPDEAS